MTNDFTATLPRKRMGAGVLLSDDRGRVLLVEPTYKDYWEIPGGAVEADESPYDAVVRELKEELALPVQPGRSLVTDWVPPRPGRAVQDYLELYRNVLNGDQFLLCPECDALWFP